MTEPLYHILDVGGLLLQRFHGCEDASIENDDGKLISSWQAALVDFLDQHIFKYLPEGAPRQFIAVWDKGNTHRLNIFPAYKKARLEKERPVALSKELAVLREKAGDFLAYIGARQVWVPGEEADDVIALLCQRLEGRKIVHTVDADLLALVSDQVSVLRKGEFHGTGSYTQYKVPYQHIALNKALVGDSSDGYGGVTGFGEKAWEKLSATLGDAGLGWLRWHLDADEPAGLQPYLEQCKELAMVYNKWPEARRGWRLAALCPEACYGSYRDSNGKEKPKRPQWRVRIPDEQRVRRLLEEMQQAINLPDIAEREANARLQLLQLNEVFPQHTLIDSTAADQLPQLMQEILASPVVSYDFESSDRLQWEPFRKAADKNYVDVLAQQLAGISINWGSNLGRTIYIPFDHHDTHNLHRDWAVWLLQSLSSREERCVVQNAAFELTVAYRNFAFMPRAPYDTAIMASYVDENEENHLKGMSQRLLGYKQLSYQETTQGRAMYELTGEEVLQYGCDDSLVTSHLFDLFRLIMQLEGSWDFYQKYEVDPAVDDAHIFVAGTQVDFARLQELQAASKARAEAAVQAIREELEARVNAQDQHGAGVAAKTLLDEWWLTDQYKFYHDGIYDEAAGNARYAALWQRAWQACFYTPKVETRESKPFVPTPLMLGQVVKLLDSGAPPLQKLTQQDLEKWHEGALDYVEAHGGLSELAHFADLLYAARKNLGAGKRQGPAYEALHDFCQEVLDKGSPAKITSTGTQLSFNSAPQMQEFLYGMLRLPIRRRSKPTEGSLREKKKLPGSPATGLKAVASALVWDVQEGDWRKPVLENYAVVCREQQLESLYFRKYPLWKHPEDGKIHPQIRNCGTATRRPSGSNPNPLQLKKGEIRDMFPAGEGRVIVSIDFASQEICLTACASEDPAMLDAFMQTPRKDLHSLTAAGIAWSILPQLGVPCNGPMSYEDFLAGLHSEDQKVAKAYSVVRNKYAKACIAEGSLVLTDRGRVPIERVCLSDLVWDGLEWVRHEGVIFKGVREVITYDGLTATPDHKVYLQGGGCRPFSEVAVSEAGPSLAVGESDGTPVRYTGGGVGGLLENAFRKVEALYNHALQFLFCGQGSARGKPDSRTDNRLQMRAEEAPGQKGYSFIGPLLRYGRKVQQPESPLLFQLWGEGDKEYVLFGTGVCGLRSGIPADAGLLDVAYRPYRQQRPLRAWESQGGDGSSELREYEKERHGPVSWAEHPSSSFLARVKGFVSGISLQPFNRGKADKERPRSGDDAPLRAPVTRREKVYDIVNAGPRHRFTVSGKVVSNCNFGVIYGSSALGIAETLQIAKEQAERILDAFFALYRRVPQWQKEVALFAREHGYVEMPFGSRRHAIADLWSDDRKLSGRQERQLSNAIIQSGAAEILKVVRQRMFDARMRERYDLTQVFPIYDEITACVPIEKCESYILELADIMRITPPGYPIGMEVDASMGLTWGSQLEIGIPTPERIQATLSQLLEAK